jgi:hypothetical protein
MGIAKPDRNPRLISSGAHNLSDRIDERYRLTRRPFRLY